MKGFRLSGCRARGGAGGEAGGEAGEPWKSRHEVAVTRVLDAPRGLVWEAWTSPARLPLWLKGPGRRPMTTCEVDLRPGGAWELCWGRGDDPELRIGGVYEEVRVPERLVSRSSWGSEWPESRESLVLEEEGGGTRVTQTTGYPSEEALDAALGAGVREGMEEALEDLAEYLASIGAAISTDVENRAADSMSRRKGRGRAAPGDDDMEEATWQ